ncbi:MAG: small, acid-soluble spore protein tlp [Angelakisella sp.]|nr:small, acid-soluble spore protein tlp [Angelakisella sp.]
MKRDLLIQQVKSEYERLAQFENSEHFTDLSYHKMSPEAYYERALEQAIRDISAGKYDDCISGIQVVERIANNKTKSRRLQDTIDSTMHNIKTTNEKIALETGSKNLQSLKEANGRRAESLPKMIREMKEEQAQEELSANSPNVIGGGGNG